MKKERSKKDTSEKDFYFTILNYLKEELSPSQISSKLKISKQKIYYYTRTLKNLGFIEKSSYGKWEVKRSKKEDLEHALNWKDKKIRGHAFIWKVKPKREYDWISLLVKRKIKYNLVRGYTPRIFINNRKIWLGKENIVIYESKSFYGRNALESRKYAVYELQQIIKELQRELGIYFSYIFKPTREHFGLIKNELAQQCNKEGEKIFVRDELDGEWLWIDDSTGMQGELETGGKGIIRDRAILNMQVQKHYNSNKKHHFKVDADYILNGFDKTNNTMQGILKIQEREAKKMEEYAEELRSHKDAIKQNAVQMGEFVNLVRELKEIIKNKENNKI